jgi:glutaredoxin 2
VKGHYTSDCRSAKRVASSNIAEVCILEEDDGTLQDMLGRYFDGVQCSINMARRAQSEPNAFNSGPEIREWLNEILIEQRDKILAEFKRQKLNHIEFLTAKALDYNKSKIRIQ